MTAAGVAALGTLALLADATVFDAGPRTTHPLHALRIGGLERFRAEHVVALADGDVERAFDRALAAIDFGDVHDGEGRELELVVDEAARVAALVTPNDWRVWPSLAWWPPPRAGWSAPILLLSEHGFAELVGSDDYPVGRAVRASGTDLAWTLLDPRIVWIALAEPTR